MPRQVYVCGWLKRTIRPTAASLMAFAGTANFPILIQSCKASDACSAIAPVIFGNQVSEQRDAHRENRARQRPPSDYLRRTVGKGVAIGVVELMNRDSQEANSRRRRHRSDDLANYLCSHSSLSDFPKAYRSESIFPRCHGHQD